MQGPDLAGGAEGALWQWGEELGLRCTLRCAEPLLLLVAWAPLANGHRACRVGKRQQVQLDWVLFQPRHRLPYGPTH